MHRVLDECGCLWWLGTCKHVLMEAQERNLGMSFSSYDFDEKT